MNLNEFIEKLKDYYQSQTKRNMKPIKDFNNDTLLVDNSEIFKGFYDSFCKIRYSIVFYAEDEDYYVLNIIAVSEKSDNNILGFEYLTKEYSISLDKVFNLNELNYAKKNIDVFF